MPIRVQTDGVSRGRGRGRGAGRGEMPGPSAPGGGLHETDSEEDPSMDSSTAPPSPHSSGNQHASPQAPLPDPALAAIHAVLVQLVQLQQGNGQPAVAVPPSQPDFSKTVMLMKNLGTPTFGGSSNPMDSDHWMECLNRNFAAIRCPSTFKKDIAIFYLERDASSWWSTVEPLYSHETITYDTFRREFERKYFPPEARDRLEVQYLELTQGTSSVREYEAEFTRLRRYAARAQQESESSVIRRFMRGLRPEVRSHLQAVEYKHLTVLVERAVNVEESLIAIPTTMVRSPSSRPALTQSNPTTRRRDKDKRKSRSGSRCNTCGRYHAGPCTQGPRACFVCGDTGHFARNCPKTFRTVPAAPGVPQHITCFTCGQSGHYATSCPQKHRSDAARSARPQLPAPPAKRPATAPRMYTATVGEPSDKKGKGPLTGE